MKKLFCGTLVPFFQSDSCRLQYLCAELLGYCKKEAWDYQAAYDLCEKAAHRTMTETFSTGEALQGMNLPPF